MSNDSKEYEVGYAKPPVHSRFQSGQSGNPRGRPKGSLSLAGAINRALREKVVVVIGGKRRNMSKLDAAITNLVNQAVKGDSKATAMVLSLAPLVGMEPATATTTLGADDAAVMEGLMQRIGAIASASPVVQVQEATAAIPTPAEQVTKVRSLRLRPVRRNAAGEKI